MGISWFPNGSSCYVLDDHLEPTIGIRNDLRRIDSQRDPMYDLDTHIFHILGPIWHRYRIQEVRLTEIQAVIADCHNERLINLLSQFEMVAKKRFIIPKAECSNESGLSEGVAEDLIRTLDESVLDAGWRINSWTWAEILLSLDKSRSHRFKTGLKVVYTESKAGTDMLDVHGLHEDAERFVYDHYNLLIPEDLLDEFRLAIGIRAPSEKDSTYHVLAVGGPGTYRAPESPV